jgi:ABC-type transport system involved in multi-copper enzyme maturation permease subunit
MNNVLAISEIVIKELYRRKDFYVLFILTALITLLMGSVNFFNDDKIVRYLKELCLLLIWISALVIAISTAARQIPSERENRTIFPLLAKPVTRGELVVGKFLGCWFACGIALLVFYVFFGLVCAAREHAFAFANYFQALWLHWMFLGVVIGLTLLGSVVLTAATNATICFILCAGILLVGRHLNKVALQMGEPGQSLVYAIYYVIPHLEFFDVRDLIIHNWDRVPSSACALTSSYAAAYTAFFLVAAWLLFRRKALN